MRFGLPVFLFFAFIDIFTRNATNPADGFLLFSYTVQHIVDCARTCVCVRVCVGARVCVNCMRRF